MFYHLKIILRNLKRDKFYSAINIGGLAIGMATSVLLLLWVYNQWSYDRFHPNAKQIHQVWSRDDNNGSIECWQSTSILMAPALKEEYPEVVEAVRVPETIKHFFGESDRQISIRTLYTDPSFLSMFSFPLLHGDAATALNDPYSIILTETAARRLFGNEDPMGKTIQCEMEHTMLVTGVMKDVPDNTRFDFEILGSFQFVEKVLKRWGTPQWTSFNLYTYVELTPHAQIDHLNASIRDIVQRNTDNFMTAESFLYPLDKSYLQASFENGVPSGGIITNLRMFAIVAVLILLIACINFVNLSTARASLRAKEVGVRKVMGSRRSGLIRLFLSESMMLAVISGSMALSIVYAALPYFSGWLGGKILSLDIFNIYFWLLALAFILFTGLLAGSYPAFYLSAFQPIKVLKGAASVARSRIPLRQILVILQFTFAVFLIIGALVVNRQITHAKNRYAGYDKEHVIHIPLPNGIRDHYAAFRYDLTTSGAVVDATRTWNPLTEMWAVTPGIDWSGKDPEDRREFNLYFADGNWAEMMGAEIVAGRFPNPAVWSTDSTAVLINETAAKMMDFDEPIGRQLSFWGFEGQIAGIIKDFVLHSPFEKPAPMVIGCENIGWRSRVHIRLTAGNVADKLATVENVYKKYSAGFPFEYTFVEEQYAAKFKDVQAIESLTGFFTVVAILISCMGLFALVAFTAERRKKEIAIRKVLGASVPNIMLLISKEYITLTTISFAIAAPLAWMVMVRFLEGFDYRTNIPVWLIAAAGILILLIALLTVGFQAIKAAMGNPVKAIKSE
jgi:ABC-type lipoprotein release transport system permease subunit